MSIGSRIKQRMQELGLKGVDITRATGVSSGGVSQWVNDLSKPSSEKLFSLSKALKCTPEWIIYGEDCLSEERGDEVSEERMVKTGQIVFLHGMAIDDLIAACVVYELKVTDRDYGRITDISIEAKLKDGSIERNIVCSIPTIIKKAVISALTDSLEEMEK